MDDVKGFTRRKFPKKVTRQFIPPQKVSFTGTVVSARLVATVTSGRIVLGPVQNATYDGVHLSIQFIVREVSDNRMEEYLRTIRFPQHLSIGSEIEQQVEQISQDRIGSDYRIPDIRHYRVLVSFPASALAELMALDVHIAAALNARM